MTREGVHRAGGGELGLYYTRELSNWGSCLGSVGGGGVWGVGVGPEEKVNLNSPHYRLTGLGVGWVPGISIKGKEMIGIVIMDRGEVGYVFPDAHPPGERGSKGAVLFRGERKRMKHLKGKYQNDTSSFCGRKGGEK